MSARRSRPEDDWDRPVRWGTASIEPGGAASTSLVVTRSYVGSPVRIPYHVIRGPEAGPTVLVTGAVHGDEINGTGAIRHLVREETPTLRRGTLVLVPVMNVLGFEQHSRYMPDRRDLNRCFPGRKDGSLASRMAHVLFQRLVRRADHLIDLHSAAVRRTNFPNVRANLELPGSAALARAFGAGLVISHKGTKGTLRRAATDAGLSAILLEAGEVWKVEPSIVEFAVRGVLNVLKSLHVVGGRPTEPAYRVEADATQWIRADHGGFLEFHVAPGAIVAAGQPLATNTTLTGQPQNTIVAPRDGIVLGMSTLPAVAPGAPVFHLAYARRGALQRVERAVAKLDEESLHRRLEGDLASGVDVREAPPDA
jgi:predicted deacylase